MMWGVTYLKLKHDIVQDKIERINGGVTYIV